MGGANALWDVVGGFNDFGGYIGRELARSRYDGTMSTRRVADFAGNCLSGSPGAGRFTVLPRLTPTGLAFPLQMLRRTSVSRSWVVAGLPHVGASHRNVTLQYLCDNRCAALTSRG